MTRRANSGGISRSTTASTNTTISSTSTSGGRKPQIVKGRYLDEQKLRAYLNRVWGPGTYALDLTRDTWTITGPDELSKEVLETLEPDQS